MTRLGFFATALLALASALPVAAAAESPGVVVVRGNKLFNAKTGERFLLKGMTYEYVVTDEQYDKYSKAVIDKYLADANINTLRLYDINPDKSYKKFMDDMAKRGVYVLVGGTPDNSDFYGPYRYATLKKSYKPDEGETCYSPVLLEFGKKVAKQFAQYDNTLGILVGNEVMQKDLTAAACVKQYVADLKTWMRGNTKYMRMLPLAYAAADSAYAGKIASAEEYHTVKIQGLLCGDQMKDGVMTQSIDIYLINEYRWCPGLSFAVYEPFLNMAQGLPIVIGFGEYGCKTKGSTRAWEMVPFFYDAPNATKGFTEVWSGGLAYSFGQAKLPADSTFPMFTGGSMDPLGEPSSTPTPDFENLVKQFKDHPSFADSAKWEADAKCKWVPELTTKVSPTNKRATEHGWIIADCKADALKVVESDTWVTRSRQNQDCGKGDDCDVPVKEVLGTTYEDICGKEFVGKVSAPDLGGGSCKTASDCSGNGECVEVNKTMQCKCKPCFSGLTCSQPDDSACAAPVSPAPAKSSATSTRISSLVSGAALGWLAWTCAM
ncbi:hypothetical protein P43SY_003800 [Pythium insidiosum]|uniref:EGF-like domain-containing protein n=1 Tax=Pythium insidiosum TaxID=114742 RepID=A0AAD5M455_PYTIN|nr:hypothetical protein P43SY_003800 [Pythium insidiosum]